MTIEQITANVALAGKTVTRATIYNYLARLGIKPVGASQRPQQYPDDAAARIKAHLGLNGSGPIPPLVTAKNLLTVPALRAVKAKAKAGKGRGK